MTEATDRIEFSFRFASSYRLPALLFGVTPASAVVVIGRGRLFARFGPWRVETSLPNVKAARHTGPYSWLKTAGPAHVSLADRGLTFATNGDAGVCIEFVEPVRGVDPLGVIKHPGLTVTVADCPGLVATLGGSDEPNAGGPRG